MENLPVNFAEFLQWIVYGGGGAIVVSWILEKLTWYQEKPADTKKNIFFGVVTAFTVLIYVVLAYVPENIVEAIAPYFNIVAVTFLSVYVGTAYHRVSKSTPPPVVDKVAAIPSQTNGNITDVDGVHIEELEHFDELKG